MKIEIGKISMLALFIFLILSLSGCQHMRDYHQDMRDFVEHLSVYAKNLDADFYIIPQNGPELLTVNGSADGNISTAYISAIDGVGREELWYGYTGDNIPTPEADTQYMLRFLNIAQLSNLSVLVTDYCWTHSYVDDSYLKNELRGYLSIAADHRELDNIPTYPSRPVHENTNTINHLRDAKNFLYLINTRLFINKSAFLTALRATNYDLLIIDLSYEDTILTKPEIDSLKTKKDGGERLVIAYISIGEAEDYRYYWKPEWKIHRPDWLLWQNPYWPGNYKVKYWDPAWQQIIYGNNESYMYKILQAGFDGAYLDRVDAFENFVRSKLNMQQWLSQLDSRTIDH